jgi:hypothetical protein
MEVIKTGSIIRTGLFSLPGRRTPWWNFSQEEKSLTHNMCL